MPKYRVEAIEQFYMRTTYHEVEADSQQDAEKLCQSGNVAYDDSRPIEGHDNWIETLSVTEEEE